MRLSLHTDYGLRTLMYLAARGQRTTIAEIATFFKVSKDHVAKVVQRLARSGLIISVRGVGGGLELARPAEQITIGEVVGTLEGNMDLLDCVRAETNVCVIQPSCRLRSVLQKAEELQTEYLRSIKLSDVVEPGRQLVALSL